MLGALASSLELQSYRNFEWLVVDDGSDDDTAAVLAGIATGGWLSMKVITTANGGKHRALNRGIPEARGEWTFIVDSDDRLPPDALLTIAELAAGTADDENLCGIMGLKGNFSGTVVGGILPETLGPVDAASLTYLYGVRDDKAEVYRTDVLKRYPFPEFMGEKFLTECVVWYRMARDGYRLKLANELLYLCEYREDGLSARSLELRMRNPQGTLLFYSEELLLKFAAWRLVREAANLVRFALHARRFGITFRELPRRSRMLAITGFPLGLAAAVRDLVVLRAGRA